MKNDLLQTPELKYLAVLLLLFLFSSNESVSFSKTTDRDERLISASGNTPDDKLHYIFESGKDGYTCFRIPSIIQTGKGVLLAFAEGRKGGCSDTGNIDLVLKRSKDGGKTWGKLEVVWNDGENTCGNPAPVLDKVTGEVFLLSTWNLGSDHEKEIISGQSEDTRRVFVLSSKNGSKSWSKPREITNSVKKENWTWYATGPVSGIQLENSQYRGRLVIPCDYVESETKKGGSHVIFSDDHGKTWELGGVVLDHNLNESTVAELSSGVLMLNMRNYGSSDRTRKIALSEDGGLNWSHAFDDADLIEPVCQGSLISYKFADAQKSIVVFSNPADKSKRINMTVKFSPDEGNSWPFKITVHEGPGAYSNLVSLKNGDLGIFFEAGEKSPYEGLAFKIIPSGVFSGSVTGLPKAIK